MVRRDTILVSDVNIDDLLDDEGWSLLNELTEEELELLNADFDPQNLLTPLNGRKGDSQNGPMFKKEDLVENLERIVAESIPVIKNEKIRKKEEVKKQVKEEKLKRQYSKDRPSLVPQRSIALTDEEEDLLNNATEEELIEAAEDVKQDFTRICNGSNVLRETQDHLSGKSDISSSLHDQHASHDFQIHDKFHTARQENQSDNRYTINEENFKKLMQYHVKKKKRKKTKKSTLRRIKKYNNFVLQYNSKIDSDRLLTKENNEARDFFVNGDFLGDTVHDIVSRDSYDRNDCNKKYNGDKFKVKRIKNKTYDFSNINNASKNDSLNLRKTKNNINGKLGHNDDNLITDNSCQMNLNIYINNSKQTNARRKSSKIYGKNLSGILENLGKEVTEVNFRVEIKLKADHSGIISTLTRCTVHPDLNQNNVDVQFDLKDGICATNNKTSIKKDIAPKSPNKKTSNENESRTKREDRSGRQSCDSGICQTPTNIDDIFFDDGYGTLQNSYTDGEFFSSFNEVQNNFDLTSDRPNRHNQNYDYQHQDNNTKKKCANSPSTNTNMRGLSQNINLESSKQFLSPFSAQNSLNSIQSQNAKSLSHSQKEVLDKRTSFREENKSLKKWENESKVKQCPELKIEQQNHCNKEQEFKTLKKKQSVDYADCSDGLKALDEVRSKLRKVVRIDSEQKDPPYEERPNMLVNEQNFKSNTTSSLATLLQQDKEKREKKKEKVNENVVEADHRGVSAALLQQALLKMNGILTNEQISSVWAGEKPKGSSIRTTSSVKATEQRKCITQADEETELDIVELMRCCREDTDDLFYICINNQPNLERSIKLEVIKTVERSLKVKHLSMAMTGLIDFEVKELANALRYNSVMETLNLESNIITMHGILVLMTEVGRHPSLREVKISNQKQPFGLQGEECMAAAIDKNENIIKFGYSFTQPGPRNKADRAIIRHNENLRQRRKNGDDVFDLKIVSKIRDEWPQPWIRVKGRRGLEKLIENKVLDMGHMSNGDSNPKSSDSSSSKAFNIKDVLTQRKSNSQGSKIAELEKEQERKRKQQFKEMEEYSNNIKILDISSKREEKIVQNNNSVELSKNSAETDYRRVAQSTLPQSREPVKGINVNEILALRKDMKSSSKIRDLEKEQERKRKEHFKELKELSKLENQELPDNDNDSVNTPNNESISQTISTMRQVKQESDKRVNESDKQLNNSISKQASAKLNMLEELEKKNRKEKVIGNVDKTGQNPNQASNTKRLADVSSENRVVNHEQKLLSEEKHQKNEVTKDKTPNEDLKTKTSSLPNNSSHVANTLKEEKIKGIEKVTEENAGIKNKTFLNNKIISNQPRESKLQEDAKRNMDSEKKNNNEKSILEDKKESDSKQNLVDNKELFLPTNKDSVEIKQRSNNASLNNSSKERNMKTEEENKKTEVTGKFQRMSNDKKTVPPPKNETTEKKKSELEKINEQREAKKKEDEAKRLAEEKRKAEAEEKRKAEDSEKRQKMLFENKSISNKDSRSSATPVNKEEIDQLKEQKEKKEGKNENQKPLATPLTKTLTSSNKEEISPLSSNKSEVKNEELEKKEQIGNTKNQKEEDIENLIKTKKSEEEFEHKQKSEKTVESKTSAPNTKDNSFGLRKVNPGHELKETKTKEEETKNLIDEKKKTEDIDKKQRLFSANKNVDNNTSGTKGNPDGFNTKGNVTEVKNRDFNKLKDNIEEKKIESETNKKIEEKRINEKTDNKEKLPLENKNVTNINNVSHTKSELPEGKKPETSKLSEYRESRKKEEEAKKIAEEKRKNEEIDRKQSDNKNLTNKNEVMLPKNSLPESKKDETDKIVDLKEARKKDPAIDRKQKPSSDYKDAINNNNVSLSKSIVPDVKKGETSKLSEYRDSRKKEEEAKKLLEEKRKDEEIDKKQKPLSDNKNLTNKNDAPPEKSKPSEVKNGDANKLREYRETRRKEEDKKEEEKKKVEPDKKPIVQPDNKNISNKNISSAKDNAASDVSLKESKHTSNKNGNAAASDSKVSTVKEEVKKQLENKKDEEPLTRKSTETKEVRKKEEQPKTTRVKEDGPKKVPVENVSVNSELAPKKTDTIKSQVSPRDEKKIIVESGIKSETINVCNTSASITSANNVTNEAAADIFSGRSDDNDGQRLSLKERMARRGK